MKKGWLILLGLCALTAALKLPSLSNPHREPDELIYLSLADNLRETGRYSLQGKPILKALAADMYDKPLFHHPPAFVLALYPLKHLAGGNSPVLASWLGHLLTLLALYLLLLLFLEERRKLWVLAAALGLTVFDPVMVYTSQKIWMDTFLTGFNALGVALFLWALKRQKLWLFPLAGLCFAIALTTKLSAALSLPLFLYLFIAFTPKRQRLNKEGLLRLGLFLLFPLLLLGLWLGHFHSHYQTFIPSWIHPSSALSAFDPYISRTLARSGTYYFTQYALMSPLLIFWFFFQLKNLKHFDRLDGGLWLWFFLYMIVFTVLGVRGEGFQPRLVMAMVPAIYLGAARQLAREQGNRGALCAFGLAGAVTLYTGLRAMLAHQSPDVLNLFQIHGIGI